jgi:hypothetical protein
MFNYRIFSAVKGPVPVTPIFIVKVSSGKSADVTELPFITPIISILKSSSPITMSAQNFLRHGKALLQLPEDEVHVLRRN